MATGVVDEVLHPWIYLWVDWDGSSIWALDLDDVDTYAVFYP